MANFTAGTSFTDGVTNDVTALKLNALIADAVPTSNLSLNSTTGTIATFNSTTGTIPTLVATTLITTGTGTAATPAIQPTGDTNTGIFFPAADTIAFSEGGAEAMRIDSSGNVGVGTASPVSKLHIKDGTNYNLLIRQQSSKLQIFSANDAYASIPMDFNASSYSLTSGTAVNALNIDSSGNVGIGTDTPTQKLSVIGSIALGSDTSNQNSRIDVADGSSTATDSRFLFRNGTATHAALRITLNTTTGVSVDSVQANSTSTVKNLFLNTNGGEVCIAGTTDQGTYNLQVNGTGVWGAGAYVNGSDERLKENIQDISSGLDVVEKLRPVSFNYKADFSTDTNTQAGFIAQDLLVALDGKNYIDGTVSQGPTYYNVAYQTIIPILAKAIQELSAKVTALEAA